MIDLNALPSIMALTRKEDGAIRVLVVDDHLIFRVGICNRIESIGERVTLVGEASDGFAAHTIAGELHPNVILMDHRMPGVTGIEATRNIKAEFPDIQIIILSADDEPNDVNAALQAGASGYLLKSISGPELQEAILSVADGGLVLSPMVTKKLLNALSRPSDIYSTLREGELEILKMMVSGATSQSISRDLSLSISTAEAQLQGVFQKFGVSSWTEVVTRCLREGLIRVA